MIVISLIRTDHNSRTDSSTRTAARIHFFKRVPFLDVYKRQALDDLFQIGCIGLIKAIDNFDISQNVRFSTYAVPMILGEVRRYLRDNNSIRVSRSLRDIAYKAIYAREGLTRKNMKEPSIMEIADEIGVSKEEITYALDAIQSPVSLYEPVYSDGGDPLYVCLLYTSRCV